MDASARRNMLIGLRVKFEESIKLYDKPNLGDVGRDDADKASLILDEDRRLSLLKLATDSLKGVNQTLELLDDGKLNGQCFDCGDDIPDARIEAMPHTRLCRDCAENSKNRDDLRKRENRHGGKPSNSFD